LISKDFKNLFETKRILPLVYVRDIVIYPGLMLEINLSTQKSLRAISGMASGDSLAVTTLKENYLNQIVTSEGLYRCGVTGRIIEMDDIIGGGKKILFEAQNRVEISKFITEEPIFQINYRIITENYANSDRIVALSSILGGEIRKLISLGKLLPMEVVVKILSIDNANEMINLIMPFAGIQVATSQEILAISDVETRLERVTALFGGEIKRMEQKINLGESSETEYAFAEKEEFPEGELKNVKNELVDSENPDYRGLKQKIESSSMPENAKKVALKELLHLQKTPAYSPEISYISNYLEWLTSMPWEGGESLPINLIQARKTLDEDHYGLHKVKERILEYLAVQDLVGEQKGPILCFVGPPGTGKTSIGMSIARALSRKFIRVSLGGIRDEAEIRGHRRTYIGAMPGRIIQGVHQAGTSNPVFMLDEIDKIGVDFRGDPSGALLEALDPEQNINFSDHYLEIPFDLSRVTFITTANLLDNIPRALLDRLEIIEFPSYSPEEKQEITSNFIWPKILRSHGLEKMGIKVNDEVIYEIINRYTMEAGVRNLERELAKIARKIALKIAIKERFQKTITKKQLYNLLGPPKIDQWEKETSDTVGLVAALAVTEWGGEILSIEATLIPGGRGSLTLTGHLGEVMKESAQAALTYAKTIAPTFGIDTKIFQTHDIHVHVPLGAVPKDGPSAGIAIFSAIISSIIKKPIDRQIGMTGEISLRGRVLKIGGLKEKILAAKRMGITKLIIPKSNRNDLEEISDKVKGNLLIYLVDKVDDTLPIILKESYK